MPSVGLCHQRRHTTPALWVAVLCVVLGTGTGSHEVAAEHTASRHPAAGDWEWLPRRSLLQAPPQRIKGPSKVVPNCPKCRMQRIPEMCQYLPGTEPAGSTYEDEMRGSGLQTRPLGVGRFKAPQVVPDTGALARPAAPVEKRRNSAYNLRQHRHGRGRLRDAGEAGEWGGNAEIPTEELEQTPKEQVLGLDRQQGAQGGTEEIDQAVTADWGADEDRQRPSRQAAGQGFLSNLMGQIGGAGGRTGRRHLMRARGGSKKGGAARQPVFQPPGPRTTETVLGVLAKWKARPNRCGMWTRDCVRRYIAGEDLGLGILFNDTTQEPRKNPLLGTLVDYVLPAGKNVLDLYPDLKPGELGSCAVVAVGDNLLYGKRGREIDAHDTVFRYNSPIRKFAKAVGTKSDVVYWKMRNDEKDYGQEGQKASRFYMWKEAKKFWEFGSKADWVENKFKGLPLLWPTSLATEAWAAYNVYKEEKKVSVGTPPGGFKLALDVLASGLCKRLDIYGYTAKGSGKYFKRESFMKATHISGLDHWVYREAQAMGLLCTYD